MQQQNLAFHLRNKTQLGAGGGTAGSNNKRRGVKMPQVEHLTPTTRASTHFPAAKSNRIIARPRRQLTLPGQQQERGAARASRGARVGFWADCMTLCNKIAAT